MNVIVGKKMNIGGNVHAVVQTKKLPVKKIALFCVNRGILLRGQEFGGKNR
eukprot:TRINITY_DN4082_c0_g1_i1.p3 TRINITY_DN4082_c0_g1~~TRINITY_DN4082_c0_g1_i1.p3  ORF type:complete len:51 (+),score=1.29 TRINITY_DN4082_c0_g1_i1:137-289(+)